MLKNKRSSLSLLVLFLSVLSSAREAEALVPVLDGALFLHVEGTATYDTNVFTNADERKDFYVTVVPAAQFIRAAGKLHLDARVGVEVIRFIDFTNQDTEDFFTSLAFTYPHYPDRHPNRLGVGIGWRQRSAAREEVGDRVRSELFEVGGSFRRDASDRFAYRGAVDFSHEDFEDRRWSKVDIVSVSIDALHLYSEHLESFLGYRFRHTNTAGDADVSLSMNDHLLRGGVEGQLSARISGLVVGGLQLRTVGDGDGSDSLQPYGSIAASWTPRHRTEVIVQGIKDFSVTPDDRSTDRTSARVALNQGVYGGFSVEPWASYANVKIDRRNGRSREDNRYEAGFRLLYEFVDDIETSLRYSYLHQASDDPFFEYGRHLIELRGSVTF